MRYVLVLNPNFSKSSTPMNTENNWKAEPLTNDSNKRTSSIMPDEVITRERNKNVRFNQFVKDSNGFVL